MARRAGMERAHSGGTGSARSGTPRIPSHSRSASRPAMSSAPAFVAACSVKPSSDAHGGLVVGERAPRERREAAQPLGAGGRRLPRHGGRGEPLLGLDVLVLTPGDCLLGSCSRWGRRFYYTNSGYADAGEAEMACASEGGTWHPPERTPAHRPERDVGERPAGAGGLPLVTYAARLGARGASPRRTGALP